MRNRVTKVIAGFAALAALALGGATLASAGQGSSQPAKPVIAVQQQGSAKAASQMNGTATAEQPGVEESDGAAAADTDSIQDENGKDDATEPAEGAENEAAEAAESGSEVPGDDGPGGHADEPGNPNADHQFEGQE